MFTRSLTLATFTFFLLGCDISNLQTTDGSFARSSLSATTSGGMITPTTDAIVSEDCPKCTDDSCTKDTDCEDNDICTTDRCINTKCQHIPRKNIVTECSVNKCVAGSWVEYPLPNETPCNTNNPCIINEKCINSGFAGLCRGTVLDQCGGGEECISNEQCDDKNTCTIDTCNDGACTHQRAKFNTLCDDGNPCTAVDKCDAYGICHGSGNSNYCKTDNKCLIGTCNKGECVFFEENCSDEDPCTIDSCDPAIGCIHTPKNCGDDGNNCTDNTCNKITGCCESTPKDCDDHNLCTNDSCNQTQGCVNTPKCNDSDPCTIDSCNPNTGKCSHTPRNCNDNNPCTMDFCDPSRQCINLPVVGSACDDGNLCTTQDQCGRDGKCTGKILSCDDLNPCTKDSCSRIKGCLHTPVSSALCEDGNPCTTGDTCKNGVCTPSSIKNCDDNNQCTIDWCDELAGGCNHSPNPLCE